MTMSELLTMTRCWQVAVLPLASVAGQRWMLVPRGRVVGALLTTLMAERLSEAAGVGRIAVVAEHRPGSVVAMASAMLGRVGGWVSCTMTRWELVAILPQ